MMRGGRGGRGPGPGRRGGGRRRRRTTRRRRTRMRRHRRRVRRRRRRRILLAGGLIAFGAWKLSKRDAQRVEEHTGKSADELSDQEMSQAMDDLNIDKQTVDDDDKAYMEEQGYETDYLDELERLGDLHEKGYLTDEEFDMKKKQLLDQ